MPTASLALPWQTQATMTQPAEDLNLIRRMQAGDDDAVRDLYAQYGQRLYAYALRLTDDPATAEDVTQNTLVTARRTARNFRGEGRLIAWLLGIVHHTAMKPLRGSTNYLDDMAEETISADQPSPEEQAHIFRSTALHHGFVLPIPAAHEPKRKRKSAPLLPRRVIPLVNVLLDGDAHVIYRPFIAEQFVYDV